MEEQVILVFHDFRHQLNSKRMSANAEKTRPTLKKLRVKHNILSSFSF